MLRVGDKVNYIGGRNEYYFKQVDNPLTIHNIIDNRLYFEETQWVCYISEVELYRKKSNKIKKL